MTTKTDLLTPAYNSTSWNVPLNANFTTLNNALGATEAVSVAAADVTLTATQAQSMRVVVSGTLTANRTLFIPNGTTGFWIVSNATTGAYTVTVKNVSGSVSTDVTQGTSAILYSDGTNVYPADNSPTTGAVQPGTLIQYAGTTAPSGYLFCDGAAVSRATYANLFSAISTTWGAGNGSTTFNVPDLRGYFARGSGTNADGTVGTSVGAKQSDLVGQHDHTITDPGHTHTYTAPKNAFLGGATNYAYTSTETGTTSKVTTGITINNSGTGIGTETRPKNQGVLYCIKF